MKDENCIFCKIANGEIPSTTLYEDGDFRVIFDLNPATEGHCLILPKEHAQDLLELPEQLAAKVMPLAQKIGRAAKMALPCKGFNVLQNNGEAAGQTVMHFHVHIIPRYDPAEFPLWKPGKSTPEGLRALCGKMGAALQEEGA